ncbi:hypothetical protein BH20ACT5_BH20ACT5_01140 [soil metagenome]
MLGESARPVAVCSDTVSVGCATVTNPAREAADALSTATGGTPHDVAIVMGSGWLPAADALGEPDTELAVTDLPGFTAPAVAGHSGRVRSVGIGGKRVLVFLGRTHL